MSACTVFGTCCAERDLAAYRDDYGRMTGAHSIDTLTTELPTEGVGVNLRHGPNRIGDLVFGEIGHDARLRVVAVIQDGDWLTELKDLAAHIYFSPELMLRGPGVRRSYAIAERASLVGLALTPTPATVSARAISILPGDVRSDIDRRGWPLHRHALLERAIADVGHDRKRIARRLHDIAGDSYWEEGRTRAVGPILHGVDRGLVGRVISVS